MPHSVSQELYASRDVDLPDAKSSLAAKDNSDYGDEPSSGSSPESSDTSTLPANLAKSQLEDLFNEDDEDDFPQSSAVNRSPQAPLNALPLSSYSDPGVMRAFYQRIFPYRVLFKWLNHSDKPSNDFAHREFAFTLPNDAYLRYQSFLTADQFRKQCVALIPSRFEIGPVYSTNPRDRKTLRRAAAFRPISKELVFDIDMSDYDEIRSCCIGARICHRCWSFMRMAIKVIDAGLREDFGFKHILWVYSGRRGVHAWVCDKRARELDDGRRKAIAGYFELLKGGNNTVKKVNVKRPLHPHLDRSLRMLREHFQQDILNEQDPWIDESKASHLLRMLPDQQLVSALSKKWAAAPSRSSASKWADIDAIASSGDTSANFDPKRLLEAKQDVLLEYTYPRLDANVSKHLNHLLKSPFCVHPGTGRVCVPIDPRKVDDFDPLEVPTVTELLQQVDQYRGKEMEVDGRTRVEDLKKTHLRAYVDYFRGFVAEQLRDETVAKRKREEGGDPMEF